jgi:hypothetical protein
MWPISLAGRWPRRLLTNGTPVAEVTRPIIDSCDKLPHVALGNIAGRPREAIELGYCLRRAACCSRVQLAGRAGTERGIVHPADLCSGQRAARAAFTGGDLPGPEPARNGGRRLFSAAGEEPALHREAKSRPPMSCASSAGRIPHEPRSHGSIGRLTDCPT